MTSFHREVSYRFVDAQVGGGGGGGGGHYLITKMQSGSGISPYGNTRMTVAIVYLAHDRGLR